MDQRTRNHLDVAERNRDLARALLTPDPEQGLKAGGLATVSYEWVAIVAFYSAVHYVNAYVWEHPRIQPKNHRHRENLIQNDPALLAVRISYQRLQDDGFQARYTALYRVSHARATGLVAVDLARVEAVVTAVI